MPDEDKKHYFDPDNKRICELFPLDGVESKVGFLYEQMKAFSPNVVISIGDYYEMSFIYEIKRAYPSLFRWIGIITPRSLPFQPSYKEQIDYLDYAFLTSKDGLSAFTKFCNVPCSYQPFWSLGPETNFQIPETNNSLQIIACSKNSQQTNIGVLVSCLGQFLDQYEDVEAYIHTNINDEGDYNLENLLSRHDPKHRIAFPSEFVTFYDGVSNHVLFDKFSKSDVFIDCSLTSATALSAFEAVSAGCLPILVNRGASADLLQQLPESVPFSLSPIEFLGEREGLLYMVSQGDLYTKLEQVYRIWKRWPERLQELKLKYVSLAKGLALNNFVDNVKVRMHESLNKKCSVLSVDVF